MTRKEDKTRKRNIIMSLFIAFIMVSSIMGIMFNQLSPAAREFEYNGIKYEVTEDGYKFDFDDTKILFYFTPDSVEYQTVDPTIISVLSESKIIYLSYDANKPDTKEVDFTRYVLNDDFINYMDAYMINGIVEESGFSNLPVITCENATQHIPVIMLDKTDAFENQTSSVTIENNCIIMKASSDVEFMQIRDRLLYGIFGVI